jgi:hypothetical protein
VLGVGVRQGVPGEEEHSVSHSLANWILSCFWSTTVYFQASKSS